MIHLRRVAPDGCRAAGQTTQNDGPPHLERGGILAWLAIVFLFVCACVAITGVYFVHSIKVRENNNGSADKDVQVETPFGSVHVQSGKGHPESAGLPVYP